MLNNLEYPIVYGILEVKESVGMISRGGKLEDDIETVAYIVERCYLLSKRTQFFPDGTSLDEYQVVFPYKDLQYMGLVKREPEFSKQGECINSNILTTVFPSFEEAKMAASYKNKGLKDIGTLNKYLEVEQEIYDLTSDMDMKKGR